MSTNNNSKKYQSSKKRKNQKTLRRVVIAGVALIIIIAAAVLFNRNRADADKGHYHVDAKGKKYYHDDAEMISDTDLTIVKSEVTGDMKYYPYKSNNIEMEVLARKAEDGTVKYAFNTCLSCYSTGRGYFEQEGDHLVCQNCGRTFAFDNIGDKVGECYPIPIPSDNVTENDDTIVISKTYLDSQREIFTWWR